YPENYLPSVMDKSAGITGLLLGIYHFLGQRVTHVGRGELSLSLYKKAFEKQAQLMSLPPVISEDLQRWLEREQICFEDLQIIPWEWITQIGHLGMLEILFRMRDLGWWYGQAVILAPTKKIANKTMLSLFQDQAKILVNGANISEPLAKELFS